MSDSIRFRRAALVVVAAALASCAAGSDEPTGVVPVVDGGDDTLAPDGAVDDGGFNAEATPGDAPPEVVAKVWANTDDTLWQMDPTTKDVVKIGVFDGIDTDTEDMTDIAVDAEGRIFGVSALAGTGGGNVYEITIPASGTNVAITKKRSLPSGTRFYALAFAPKGVLGADEVMVAGDGAGTLWIVPTDGSAPQKIGDFGVVKSGDPGAPSGSVSGYSWQLSGDIAFFSNAGAPVGIATVRPCTSSSCKSDDDVVIEIDMTALATKNPTANLKKRFIGAASGYGRLFGIGAWNDQVFAFQRASGSTSSPNPAALISISLATGQGLKVRDFKEITDANNGWSGAGVTTSAKISLPK
ncbi:MAG: hypothetical protein HYV09_11625 [Deltaproteobacteria bacterium]|nr:hypothetical protein [Deltaproteobacteria bacterium]